MLIFLVGMGGVVHRSSIMLLALGCLTACSTVPRLDEVTGSHESNIHIRDIVRRVKCEIADAFIEKVNDPRFLWLMEWTAKVDLTLQVNNQAGITPSVGYTKFFNNAFNFEAGSTSLTNKTIQAVSQSLTFGLAGNLGEQAVRTEVVSFSLAVREIKEQSTKSSAGSYLINTALCGSGDLPELRGSLGLREWVDSALYPVEITDLQAGNHPSPGVAKPTPPPQPVAAPKPQTTYALIDALVEVDFEDGKSCSTRCEREGRCRSHEI
jgi:hypothetical protein